MHILDVGCGLGGSARYLATEYQCHVTGVDLTQEYIDVATALAKLVGLQEAVRFRQANALELPFSDQAFDIVWTEHVQMNIADKHGFYSEIAWASPADWQNRKRKVCQRSTQSQGEADCRISGCDG